MALGGVAAAALVPRARSVRSILVLGGTSYLGPAIVERALARGHLVTLFNRGKTNPGLFPGVERIHGDREIDPAIGLAGLRGKRRWDAVVDVWPQDPKVVREAA